MLVWCGPGCQWQPHKLVRTRPAAWTVSVVKLSCKKWLWNYQFKAEQPHSGALIFFLFMLSTCCLRSFVTVKIMSVSLLKRCPLLADSSLLESIIFALLSPSTCERFVRHSMAKSKEFVQLVLLNEKVLFPAFFLRLFDWPGALDTQSCKVAKSWFWYSLKAENFS